MPAEFEFHQRDRDIHPPAFTPDYKTSVAALAAHSAVVAAELALRGHRADLRPTTSSARSINDLILNYAKDGEPIGERIIVHGRVLDENGRPVPNTLVEFWQANAGGRYRHKKDTYLAPIDPNFGGCGRALTDDDGYYYFRTVKPGAYPWRNWVNNWRPAHIHFSVFGSGFAQRLITQMYFEGDPLIPHDPIFGTIPDRSAVEQLIAPLDLNAAIPLDSLAYRFDIVLRGAARRCSRTGWRGTDMPCLLDYLSRETAVADRRSLRPYRPHAAAAGFEIFEQEFGTDIAGPNAKGERIRVEGLRLRRHRRAG